MNCIGGKSNTGEGGRVRRCKPLPNGDLRLAIKQWPRPVWVTIEYLVNADVIQIKMAQGAARRGRPAARSQGDATIAKCATRRWRRPHLAAAAPRHLLH